MRFITNQPAIFHKGALIIGDTHFGTEDKLRSKGIHHEDFTNHLVDKIISLLKKTKAKRLIFLGDVKENITVVDHYTASAFEKLSKLTEITVVRGNHDGGIEKICKDVKPSEGYLYEKLGLIHGHSWPSEEVMQAEYLISAHQHPNIEFTDASGKKHFEPAWIMMPPNKSNLKKFYKKYNEKIKLILLPPFNPLAGKRLNYGEKEHLGPLLTNGLFQFSKAMTYLLNGLSLGKLKKF